MLEIIAMLSMLLDHIGAVFFPSVLWLRMIGRISLPIYVFLLARGLFYTQNKRYYVGRLLIIGAIVQVPYSMLFGVLRINIVLTFAWIVLGMYLGEIRAYRQYRLLFFLLVILFGEYSWYGLSLFLMFYSAFTKKDDLNFYYAMYPLVSVLYAFSIAPSVAFFDNVQIWAVFALPFIMRFEESKPLKGEARKFYRLFYPLHISILLIVKILLNVQ